MGRSMPKWALQKSHPKHPLYPLYACRKMIHEELASTKSHLEKLYTNANYLYSNVQQQIDWHTAQGVRIIDHRSVNHQTIDFRTIEYRTLLVLANQDAIRLSLSTFVALRHLQKEVNNVRKMILDKGNEDLEDENVAVFEQKIFMFGRLIISDLWRLYYSNLKHRTTEDRDFWVSAIRHTSDPSSVKHDILHRDRIFALIWSLEDCACYHEQEEVFSDIAFSLAHERTRFEPQTVSSYLKQIELFRHLTDTADILLAERSCGLDYSSFTKARLKVFGKDFIENGSNLFDLKKPIQHAVETLRTQAGRRENSRAHIEHSLIWKCILQHLKNAQKAFHIGSSELKELIDIFRQPKSVEPIMSPAAKGNPKRDTETTETDKEAVKEEKKEVQKGAQKETDNDTEKEKAVGKEGENNGESLLLPSAKPEHSTKEEDSVLDDGIDKNNINLLMRGDPVQAREKVAESIHKHQLRSTMDTLTKYQRRGYGKCKNADSAKKISPRSDIHLRIWQIPNAEHFSSVWRAIFPQTRQDRQISRVSWTLFVEAMTSEPVNCRVKKSDGCLFVFEKKNDEGGKEIFQCHAPHDMTWIPVSDLYRYKKDLRDTFGMDTDRISLVEESQLPDQNDD